MNILIKIGTKLEYNNNCWKVNDVFFPRVKHNNIYDVELQNIKYKNQKVVLSCCAILKKKGNLFNRSEYYLDENWKFYK